MMPRFAGQKFTVDEYHQLAKQGILSERDKVELLNGYIIEKMSRNPPHDATLTRSWECLFLLLHGRWQVRVQNAITLSVSEPEPDIAIVRISQDHYSTRHPEPADIGLVIEVSDATLDYDRDEKGTIYAQDGIVCYWVINIPDQQIEVYTEPSGPTGAPSFAHREDFPRGQSVPLILDGQLVATIPVNDLLV
jgi:hypothetical protein